MSEEDYFKPYHDEIEDHVLRHGSDIKCIKVTITEPNYSKCVEKSSDRWSNTKKGEWGSGLSNTNKDPYRVERTGLLGELAFAIATDSCVDFTYREKGDETDFFFDVGKSRKLKVDIKTAMKNYGCGLVRVGNSKHKPIEVKSDVYVFAFIESDNTATKRAEVVLVGAKTKKDLMKTETVKALKGSHFNKEIGYQQMVKIKKFIKYINKNEGKNG
jgi:hypothetical protein